MKKFYVLLLSALIASTAVAAPVGHPAQKVSKQTPTAKFNFQPRKTTFKLQDVKASRANDLILDPQGDKKLVSYAGLAIYYTFFGLSAGELTGASDVVFDNDNGKAYLHCVIGSMEEGYVEGTLSADGKKITVQYPQVIGYVAEEDEDGNDVIFPVSVSVMNKVVVDGYIDFLPELPSTNVVEYNINEDGSIAMTPFQDGFVEDSEGYLQFPDKMLSCYITAPKSLFEDLEPGEEDSDIDVWYYDGNITQVFTPLPDDLLQYEIPENLSWTPNWRMVGENGTYALCDVAFDAEYVYVRGLVEDSDATIVGTLADGKVTFKDGQYLGVDDYYGEFIFLTGATTSLEYDEEYEEYYYDFDLSGEDMVFAYDADKQEMVMQGNDKGLLINSSLDRVYYYDAYVKPVLTFQTDAQLCVAPPAPTIADYSEYEGWDPEVMIYFNNVLNDGTILSYDNMSFEMYINGELNVFDAYDYELDEDMTEVPCYFDNYYLACYGRVAYITLFDGGIETIGVRAINNAPDGKKYYSEITTYEVSGLKAVDAEQGVKAVRYFDLQGRAVASPKAGQFLIKVITLDNGSNRVVKEILK